MTYSLSSEDLRDLNIGLIGYHEYPKSYMSDACFSSFMYRNTLEEQVTDIVVKLVKSHYFPDGNKRTATLVYYILCKHAKIKSVSDSKIDKVIEYIVSYHVIDISDETFSKYVKLLFPKFKEV